MDGQLLFLQEDHYWLLFLPSMFVLLVLLVFFPACLPLQKVTAETKAEMDKAACFSLTRLQNVRNIFKDSENTVL